MNILWIPNFCPFPSDCGGKVVISHRMKYVAEKHNIYMITQSDGIDQESIHELESICKDYKLVDFLNGGKVKYIKWALHGPINAGRYSNPEITKAVKNFLEQYHIDLINLDLPMCASALFPIWKQIENIPIVVNQHNIEYKNVLSKVKVKGVSIPMRFYALLESRRLYLWEQRLYKKKNVIGHIFLTQEDLDLFTASFKETNSKLLVSPMGTDRADESNEITLYSDDRPNIVFSAAYNYKPNIHGALWFVREVFPLIKEKCNNARLILVGREPVQEIRELVTEDIVVTGTVPTVKPYFSIASIFIIPIFYGGGVKTKLIEAGVYEKPVISTSAGARGTSYQNKVDLLIADDAHQFAEACVDAICNPDKYLLMTKHMKYVTETQYLWESIGNKYVKSLEELKNFYQ